MATKSGNLGGPFIGTYKVALYLAINFLTIVGHVGSFEMNFLNTF